MRNPDIFGKNITLSHDILFKSSKVVLLIRYIIFKLYSIAISPKYENESETS